MIRSWLHRGRIAARSRFAAWREMIQMVIANGATPHRLDTSAQFSTGLMAASWSHRVVASEAP